MAKPGSLPEWNSGGANNVPPSAGKKVLGWVTNEIVPSGTLNWWMKLVHEWTAWLNGLQAEALTWTAQQRFNTTIDARGNGDENAALDVPINPTGTYKLLLQWGLTASGKGRLYTDALGQFFITVNAEWDVDEWHRDNASVQASRLYLSRDGVLYVSTAPVDSSPDSVWTSGGGYNGQLKIGSITPPTTGLYVFGILNVTGALTAASAAIAGAVSTGALTPSSIVEEALITPTLEAGYSEITDAPKYWKSKSGVVHLSGNASGQGGNTIFTLPAGYRPPHIRVFPTLVLGATSVVAIQVNTSGGVFMALPAFPTSAQFSFDGIAFRV